MNSNRRGFGAPGSLLLQYEVFMDMAGLIGHRLVISAVGQPVSVRMGRSRFLRMGTSDVASSTAQPAFGFLENQRNGYVAVRCRGCQRMRPSAIAPHIQASILTGNKL